MKPSSGFCLSPASSPPVRCRHILFAGLFFLAALALPAAEDSTAYSRWVKPWSDQPATSAALGGAGLKLIVSCVESEKPEAEVTAMSPKDRLTLAYHLRVSTTEVATNGCCRSYVVSNSDARTSPNRQMAQEDWALLDTLLSQLPADHGVLPPAGKRVVIQIRTNDRWQVLVYDGNNLPTETENVLTLLARPYDKLF